MIQGVKKHEFLGGHLLWHILATAWFLSIGFQGQMGFRIIIWLVVWNIGKMYGIMMVHDG